MHLLVETQWANLKKNLNIRNVQRNAVFFFSPSSAGTDCLVSTLVWLEWLVLLPRRFLCLCSPCDSDLSFFSWWWWWWEWWWDFFSFDLLVSLRLLVVLLCSCFSCTSGVCGGPWCPSSLHSPSATFSSSSLSSLSCFLTGTTPIFAANSAAKSRPPLGWRQNKYTSQHLKWFVYSHDKSGFSLTFSAEWKMGKKIFPWDGHIKQAKSCSCLVNLCGASP